MLGQFKVLMDVISRLDQAGIDYMITGSLAMNFYAQPRMTRDVDLVVDLHAEHADHLVVLFEEEYYVSSEAVRKAIANRSMFNVIHLGETMKVDLIVCKASAYRQLEFQRRRAVNLEGATLQIVSVEDLVLSKLDWLKDSRSEMQMGDVRNLLDNALELDRAYLEEWAGKLGLTELLEEIHS